ncbi:SDR family NAD(P)-dependent oxidoreductase [Pseudomonas batumici]|uniref:SDR family NAD(P)-dependent oxidoreductase n=1 Tax=Pseudomonas batumici TaxID=226910 RepID=UPI0030CD4BF5
MTTTPALNQALPANLQGRTVVIFGGTSGIGLAAAIQAKADGAHVTIIGSDATRAEQAARNNGLDAWRAADVTDSQAIHAALADIPKVDHLVLLAGTYVVGNVLDAGIDHLRRAFEERLWASVHAIRALGERLAKDGSIIFISGMLSDRPNAHGTAVLAAASAARGRRCRCFPDDQWLYERRHIEYRRRRKAGLSGPTGQLAQFRGKRDRFILRRIRLQSAACATGDFQLKFGAQGKNKSVTFSD